MTDISRTIDAVWRIESAKLIAGLTRMVRDVSRRVRDQAMAARFVLGA